MSNEKKKKAIAFLKTAREFFGITGSDDTIIPETFAEFTGKDGKVYRVTVLEVGNAVGVQNGEAWEPAPDGDIEQEDGTIISVKDGVVESIKPATEVAPEQQAIADEIPATAPAASEDYDLLKKEVTDISAALTTLTAAVGKIQEQIAGVAEGMSTSRNAMTALFGAVEELAGGPVEQPLEAPKSAFSQEPKDEKALKKLKYAKALAAHNSTLKK